MGLEWRASDDYDYLNWPNLEVGAAKVCCSVEDLLAPIVGFYQKSLCGLFRSEVYLKLMNDGQNLKFSCLVEASQEFT